ncbi:MAG TPA: class I mannose-6-phosphate isomerase [Phycisphaerae bacterium]|nr:class I mannose-6-phosphate isomerase [Phycisphaerae bacterium]
MDVYPLKFNPIYKEKIWGGRSFERLFHRELPPDTNIGESWELADLPEGVSIVSNGEYAGRTLSDITVSLGEKLLGQTPAMPDGRFPLLLKFLDAEDILSLQVHPDKTAVAQIGGKAALKTECWYIVESREGYIYRGIIPGTTPAEFKQAIETDQAEKYVKRYDCRKGDFYHLPAGTVHAVGPGLVIAEVQTPSDTTYRVTDWGRGREIHVERSMQCIHFAPTPDNAPGAAGDTLWVTDYFTVSHRVTKAGQPFTLPTGVCSAMMFFGGDAEINHAGDAEPTTQVTAGNTILLPATLEEPVLQAKTDADWLEITLPARQ